MWNIEPAGARAKSSRPSLQAGSSLKMFTEHFLYAPPYKILRKICSNSSWPFDHVAARYMTRLAATAKCRRTTSPKSPQGFCRALLANNKTLLEKPSTSCMCKGTASFSRTPFKLPWFISRRARARSKLHWSFAVRPVPHNPLTICASALFLRT